MATFGKPMRVRQGWEFKRVYRKGRRLHHPALTLVIGNQAKPRQATTAKVSDDENTRLGLSVSRKVGNAVVRNRIKRRLREIFRLHAAQMVAGKDLVVVPKAAAQALSYRELETVFLGLCKKGGLFKQPS